MPIVLLPTDVALKSESCRIAISNVSNVESKSYTRITFLTDKGEKTVDVYPGKQYTIKFYSTGDEKVITASGTIQNIDSDTIYLESISAIDSTTCLCATRYNLGQYVKVYIVSAPMQNIYDITEIPEIDPNNPPIPEERNVVIVSVLGLSAEICRSVIIRLRIYKDNRVPLYSEVPVDVKVGNTYKLTYIGRADQAVYELEGKLIEIVEAPKFGGFTQLNGYMRNECCQEVVGEGNTIYDADHFMDLPKDYTDGEKIKLIFDSSKSFESTYDTVWLKDIRSIELVKEDGKEPDTSKNNCPYAEGCPFLEVPPEMPDEPSCPGSCTIPGEPTIPVHEEPPTPKWDITMCDCYEDCQDRNCSSCDICKEIMGGM